VPTPIASSHLRCAVFGIVVQAILRELLFSHW
jgi:hypothetical protein